MVICLELGADLHMAQLMPLPLTVSCFSKIQIGFAFLVPAYPGSPGKRAVKNVCGCGHIKTRRLQYQLHAGQIPATLTPFTERHQKFSSMDKTTKIGCHGNVPSGTENPISDILSTSTVLPTLKI